jgi:hypothetical protein
VILILSGRNGLMSMKRMYYRESLDMVYLIVHFPYTSTG